MCISCPAGTYSAVIGATSVNTCVSCPEGTYSSTRGAVSRSTCLNCPRGTFSTDTPGVSLSACHDCDINTYSTGNGLPGCAQCPAGSTTFGQIRAWACYEKNPTCMDYGESCMADSDCCLTAGLWCTAGKCAKHPTEWLASQRIFDGVIYPMYTTTTRSPLPSSTAILKEVTATPTGSVDDFTPVSSIDGVAVAIGVSAVVAAIALLSFVCFLSDRSSKNKEKAKRILERNQNRIQTMSTPQRVAGSIPTPVLKKMTEGM
jgi:hypothetical protein